MTAADEIRHGAADDMRDIAGRLESDNPLSIVVFGVYSREFVSRFATLQGTVIAVSYPGAMPGRMRQIEHTARILRALTRGLADGIGHSGRRIAAHGG
jgi:hypothetical protein